MGHHPNSDLFKGILDLDSEGYILTRPNTQLTSVDGGICCGDVADPVYQQESNRSGEWMSCCNGNDCLFVF